MKEKECQEAKGEVWIAGSSVSLEDYWNKRELNAEVFGQHLDYCKEDFLRTGDLWYVQDGDLDIVPRLKDLIVNNGKSIAPSDVEKCTENRYREIIRPGSSAPFQSSGSTSTLFGAIRDGLEMIDSLEILNRVKSECE